MEEDRISQLSNDILQQILNKIDSYQAVETSILSRRWRNLWCSLPNLRFHLGCGRGLKPRYRSEFVFHFLSHRDFPCPVHDFHLSFDNSIARHAVEEYVLFAIIHGVQSLRLHATAHYSLRLPSRFITSTTLRELVLRHCHSSVYVPGRLSLPNLKTLYLEATLVIDDDDNDHKMEPFAGLPELEKLTLRGCSQLDEFVLKAPKLRVLEIVDTRKVKEISAPLLTSFRYECRIAWECQKVNLPMLEQVYLDIHKDRDHYNGNIKTLVMMLQQFGNATTVSVTLDTVSSIFYTFKVLERSGGQIPSSPPFPKMKCLKVMEGRNGTRTVPKRIMNYLTERSLYSEVELPPGVAVI